MGRRETALRAILRRFPGNSTAVQRERMLTAMKETGSITTFEATRLLDVYDPRPRVHELRHQFGYPITTAMRAEQTESGVLHRVGTYFLTAGKREAA
jgi:hypothetical protein